ncbi:MAG: sigma-70 family RNA polymerase sigma factor [Planctomycetota bacterium]
MVHDIDLATARDARAAHAGSRAAFAALVERFEGPLFRYLRVRTGNRADAEELVQEAFLQAWRNVHSYDPRRPFRGWLYTIAARLAASRARRRHEDAIGDEALKALPLAGRPSSAIDARDEERNLWRIALEVLGPEQREALWLRYAEELSTDEVARILGKRVVTTRVLVHRARKRLVEHLSARADEEGDVEAPAPHRAGVPAWERAMSASGGWR